MVGRARGRGAVRSGAPDRRTVWSLTVVVPLVAALAVGIAAASPGRTADRLVGEPAPWGAGPEGTERADLGGEGTAVLLRGRPFHQDDRLLDTPGQRDFAAGAEVFGEPVVQTPPDGSGQPFSPRPGTTPPPEVTGPLFDAATCMACHVDGTEARPVGAPGPGVVVRVADAPAAGSGAPHPAIGHQLSTRATPGARPEGRVELRWERLAGTYGDGTPYVLRRPLGTVRSHLLEPGDRPAVSLRVAPPLLGLGLLESIPRSDLDAAADADDADGDGISGRVPRGRFGWKAAQPTVRAQTVVALALDMGVTTGESPDPCRDRPVDCAEEPGERPELFGDPFDDLLLYTEAIAVPRARGLGRPEVRRGAGLFGSVGCAACHSPVQRTGAAGTGVDPLYAGRTVHPYTDLLLHDLGPGLDDGVGEPGAAPSEWRTAPLWGIGWREAVYGGGRYLHDGRARTLEEAVLWHGGEAARARDRFASLRVEDRDALVAFLRAI